MPIQLGNNTINKMYIGSTEIERVYLGNDLVYSTPATISGVGYNGQTLTSDKNGGQWYADGSPISGETGLTYVVDHTTEGASFTYRIAGTDSNALHHWTPLDASNQAQICDPANPNTITNISDEVQQLNDLSGNNRHWKAPTATNRPATNGLTLNGLNVIEFGANDYMELDSGDRYNEAQTVLLVMRGGTSNSSMLTGTLSGASFSPAWNINANSLTYRGNTNTATRTATLSGNVNNFGIGIIGVDGTNNRVRLYAYDASFTNFNQTVNSSDILVDTLGRDRAGAPQFSEGDLAYQAVYNIVPTTDLVERLQGFAAHRYAMTSILDSGHAYKTTPPNA